MERKFRYLNADEIDVRVATVVEGRGVSLLLYKDARADMNILDETVGAMNWQRSHTRDNANCIVSIWDDNKGQWISKEDTGTESYTEKEKGLASDSFKRACTNWGIGRELYTSPFIWIAADKIEWKEKNGKKIPKSTFSVKHIAYNMASGGIMELEIITDRGVSVFKYDPCGTSNADEVSVETYKELNSEIARTGVSLKQLLANYKIKQLSDITEKQAQAAIKRLKEKPTKEG